MMVDWPWLIVFMFAAFMTGYSSAYRFYCQRCGGRDTYREGKWVVRCHACERKDQL